MAKVRFDNGIEVEFDRVPTPKDIEEVAMNLKLTPLQSGSSPQVAGDVPRPSEFKRFLPTKEQVPELIGSMAGAAARKTLPGMALSAGGAAVGEGIRQAVFEKEPLTAIERAKKIGDAGLRGAFGELAGRGIGKAIGAAFDPFAKNVTPEITAQAAAATRAGVVPPLSAMTDSPRVQAIERAAEYSPIGGAAVTAKKKMAVKQLESYAEKISDNISPDNPPELVGEMATAKVKLFEQAFRKAKNALYEPIMAKLKGFPVRANNTISMIKEVIEQQAGGKEGQALLQDWLKRLSPIPESKKAGIPSMLTPDIITPEKLPGWEVLKAIRSEIGSRGDFNDPSVKGMKAQLERIYAAASKDIDDVARQYGMADALDAADAMYSKGIKKLQNSLIRTINKKAENSPETLYRLLIRKDSPTLVKTGREILGNDGFNQVRKQWFDDLINRSMVNAEGEVSLSPAKLATNLRKVGSSLDEIFSDSPRMRGMVNDLTDTANMLTRGQKVTSGTQTSFIGKDTLITLRGLISAVLTNTNAGRKFLMSGFPEFGRKARIAATRTVQPTVQLSEQNLAE